MFSLRSWIHSPLLTLLTYISDKICNFGTVQNKPPDEISTSNQLIQNEHDVNDSGNFNQKRKKLWFFKNV
jgi:hypothetical protein